MIRSTKYIAICTLFIPLATGAVTNTAGPRLIDILDNTAAGLNGDEPTIGYVTYNQVGGKLLIDIHVLKNPVNAAPPCDIQVELVTESPDGLSPDWATGGITEAGAAPGFEHFGDITNPPNGSMMVLNATPPSASSFIFFTNAGKIAGAQGAGLRNYGHINLEACGLGFNQVGASRVEWITTP